MDSSSTFLDANILLEIILDRDKSIAARNLIENGTSSFYISALTAHLVIHFGQSIVDLPILREFLADYTVLSLESSDFEWAFINLRNTDFEDALQLAVAIRNGCNEFITLDRKLAKSYSDLLPIQTRLLN
jgi:predicted nucleic acid-binding protein